MGFASETQVLLVDERRWAQLVAETHLPTHLETDLTTHLRFGSAGASVQFDRVWLGCAGEKKRHLRWM